MERQTSVEYQILEAHLDWLEELNRRKAQPGLEHSTDNREAVGSNPTSPTKFRKKPVEVEALQWTGENVSAIRNFVTVYWQLGFGKDCETLYIETLEGDMRASKGDWIVKGIKGEFHPVKPDIFALTYEEVKSE